MFRRSLLVPILAIGFPLLAVVAILMTSDDGNREGALINAGYISLRQGRYRDAERLALDALAKDPQSIAGLVLAAYASANAERYADVDQYLARLASCERETDPSTEDQLIQLSEALIERHHLAMGERVLRFLTTQAPLNLEGHRKLSDLLAKTGRRREAREHTIIALPRAAVTVHELVMAADDSNVFQDAAKELTIAHASVPDDPIASLGVAWTEYQSRNPGTAESVCREALKYDPDLLDAHALLGALLLDRGDIPGLKAWNDALPASAAESDEIWAVRGAWLRNLGEYEAAARCFWEAVRRNPNHRLANLELGKLLSLIGKKQDAEAFLQRGNLLGQLRYRMNSFDSDDLRDSRSGLQAILNPTPKATTDAMKLIADLLDELQREEEAKAWAEAALQLTPDLTWPVALIQHMSRSSGALDQTQENPALQIDLSYVALTNEVEIGDSKPGSLSNVANRSDVRFQDDAASSGVYFTYFNSPHNEPGKSWPFEWPGGGNGILDYDLDGWPDFYLPQGCPLMPYHVGHEYRDVLYQNRSSDRFVDVSAQAGLDDRAFGHACAVGDYDNDGFPDLYVCNLGQSRLHHNNGDGTFSEVTELAGLHNDSWSVCAAIADLNGDGFAEIYEVNHMDMESVYLEVCRHGDVSLTCDRGRKFHPGQDRLFENQQDGSFADVTTSSGVTAPLGFGLGIVVADFSDRGKLDLFIANDGYANFYYVNQTSEPGGHLEFTENAVTSGIAFDPNGAAQACMGVAVADTDSDRLLDLFVTNYYEEANAFYHQTSAEFFVEDTRPAGLSEPSFALLGFGTQFIDGELDGLRDLIITNGDVEDFSESGRPYRQRPQYYRNIGNAKFQEVPSQKLGSFFEGEYLGRGMSRLDWNRDGLEDCLVSHLDSQVALLTNKTPIVGNYLAIQLRGVKSARDAIGARVTLKIGDESWVQSLMAGDGYMASNQRQLVFGIGEHQQVDSLMIDWPAGGSSQFFQVAAGTEILIVEGRSQFVSIPR